ncbi:response regulator [Pedobacter cryophilus]|uniref:Response regulator n=1 Tax=Pedobacter cryophilus TaxID=2571271 RepID=A0A4U1C2H3_9SPHI|nr:response regulator [Pedobacter cryophilus]TKB99227.1 response regulator [Pedobacter cryophilus]
MEKRILIFDDDVTILDIMEYVLEDKGWKVFISNQSNNAIEKVTSIMPCIIIMDYNIPDIGGVNAIKNIKKQKELQHIPIVLFSAHADIKKLATDAQADAYLSKPFDLGNLYKTLEQLSKNN